MSNKITAIVLKDGTFRFEEIEASLKNMQRFVGGYIEVVPLGPELDLIVNEEGKLMNLPMSAFIFGGADVVCGPLCVMRHDDEGEPASVLESDLEVVKSLIEPVAVA